MSKTLRNILTGFRPRRIKTGGDAQVDNSSWSERRMKPYTKDIGFGKMVASRTCYTTGYMKGVSHYDKLTTRNANRSMKKSMRQQNKKEIQLELETNI